MSKFYPNCKLSNLHLVYCTISITSAWGATCDQSDELLTSADWAVTWNALEIFGSVVLSEKNFKLKGVLASQILVFAEILAKDFAWQKSLSQKMTCPERISAVAFVHYLGATKRLQANCRLQPELNIIF